MNTPTRELQDLLDRHRAFWHHAPAVRPLIGRSREGSFFVGPLLALGLDGEGIVAPADIPDPLRFLPHLRDIARQSILDGDIFWAATPPRAIPWMEAIVGCPILLSARAETMTAATALCSDDKLIAPEPVAAWRDLLSRFAHVFGEEAARTGMPVAHTLLRGPADMLMAMLGGQRFCLELVDHPAEMARLAEHCTALWIDALRMQYAALPTYSGGHFSGVMGLWAPGSVAVFQEDATSFLSPRLYRQYFLSCDTAIADTFDFSLMHLHSTGLQVLDAVLEISALDAINIVVDPSGPTLRELLHAFRRVQTCKALHLHGTFDERDVDYLCGQLDPGGLCLWSVKED